MPSAFQSGFSAVATIFTGTNPCYHGIVSGTVFNTERSKEESIFYDLEKPGNFTDDFVSPKALLTSTICDELKVASGGKSDVYAVAPSLEQAIISAGHAANTVLWIDNITGNWAGMLLLDYPEPSVFEPEEHLIEPEPEKVMPAEVDLAAPAPPIEAAINSRCFSG